MYFSYVFVIFLFFLLPPCIPSIGLSVNWYRSSVLLCLHWPISLPKLDRSANLILIGTRVMRIRDLETSFLIPPLPSPPHSLFCIEWNLGIDATYIIMVASKKKKKGTTCGVLQFRLIKLCTRHMGTAGKFLWCLWLTHCLSDVSLVLSMTHNCTVAVDQQRMEKGQMPK